MELFVGTSGYCYKEWKGSFYPEKLPQNEMLNYYSRRFATVEINNTFYKMPEESILAAWIQQVPESFRFVLKAPQLITHRKRLKNAEIEIDYLLRAAVALQDNRGPLLFQLPPNLKKDVLLLHAFLSLIGSRVQTAVEFRHASWLDDEVTECLRAHSCALCVADVDNGSSSQLVSTAGWGYIRLRREAYSDKQLKDWIKRIKSQQWDSAFVFFKHEDTGTGPKLAARFLELAGP